MPWLTHYGEKSRKRINLILLRVEVEGLVPFLHCHFNILFFLLHRTGTSEVVGVCCVVDL